MARPAVRHPMPPRGVTICEHHGLIERPAQDNLCPQCGEELVWYADQVEAALAISAPPPVSPGLFDRPADPPLIGNPVDRRRVTDLLRTKLQEATAASKRGFDSRAQATARARIDLLLELYLPLVGIQPKRGGT